MRERIKALRRELELTQKEFGDSIQVKQSTIATYENGRNEPVDSVIKLICMVHGVNEEWLRTGKGEMFKERTSFEKIAELSGKLLAKPDDKYNKAFTELLLSLIELNQEEFLKWYEYSKLVFEKKENK